MADRSISYKIKYPAMRQWHGKILPVPYCMLENENAQISQGTVSLTLLLPGKDAATFSLRKRCQNQQGTSHRKKWENHPSAP